MWHDHDIDFVRWLQPVMWHVALESWQWVTSPSRNTLQCDTWLWDDMPLNSPKRPPYWNSTSGFHFHTSPQSTCHSAPVSKILSKSDQPRQKKMTSCRFSLRISAILDCIAIMVLPRLQIQLPPFITLASSHQANSVQNCNARLPVSRFWSSASAVLPLT